LVQGLFRTALDRPEFAPYRLVARGTGDLPATLASGQALRPIDKILALQRMPLFSSCSAPEVRNLLGVAREIALSAGQTLLADGDPPSCVLVLSGEVAVMTTPHTHDALNGDAVGLYETLAGVPLGVEVRATKDGRALRISHDDLFDVLGQRPDLLKQLFAGVFEGRGTEAITPRA
jgi:CRP-like cAMP-binding protein